MITVTVVVTETENSIRLCKWLNNNIKAINDVGLFIKLKKVPTKGGEAKELIASLKSRGITRLPALISPDGKNAIGTDDIIKKIKMNLAKAYKPAETTTQQTHQPTASISEMDTHSYIAEMLNSSDSKDDPISEDMGAGFDYSARLEAFTKRRDAMNANNKHKNKSRPLDEQENFRREDPEPAPPKKHQVEIDDDDDNVSVGDESLNAAYTKYINSADNSLDKMMLNALMNNTSSGV